MHFPCILVKPELPGASGGRGHHCSLQGAREGWKCRVLQNNSPLAEAFDFQAWERGMIIASILRSSERSDSESGWQGAMGQILMRDERGAGAGGVVSSRHCHMSPASPFSWNLWTWSAYLGKRQGHVNSQQGPKCSGGGGGRDLENT